jgi:hypothetical protein
MANTIKESKGVASQRDILTHVRCPICNNLMRQNEIGVEIAFRPPPRRASPRADHQAHQELQSRLVPR